RGTGVVLVVEDEEPCRIFSTRALREKGYAVHEASDPETGLKIIEKQGDKIDLLISDVVMAQMDGPTMAKKIRKQYPELRIIFVSGYAEENIRANIQTDEKTFFLPKPYGLKELTEMVRKVIGEKKLKDSGN
ncbi:MAG: response regulator, partial [Alphaproteobacteria bacterium]|nr:response regulator [Alphaproteobacteria bacterium]